MKREADLQRRLQSLQKLSEAVSAMKSLSAHHFRESRAALPNERLYAEGLERVVKSTGAFLPAGAGDVGLLIIGPDLGLCGSYGTQIADTAIGHREELGPGPTFTLGRRNGILLKRRGLTPDLVQEVPTSVRGITDTLLDISRAILGTYVDAGLSRFDVVSSRFEGVGSHPPVVTTLLPIDVPADPEAPPVRYVSSASASQVAVRELLYIRIHGLLLDALTSEHSARLLATQVAEQWLDEKTDHLRRHIAAARREASTQEVVEISAGVRARKR